MPLLLCADSALSASALEVLDAEGKASRLSLWNEAGDNMYGYIARCRRVADAMEQLLGDEVYHWHSKVGGTRDSMESGHVSSAMDP